ncbi:hypothetical protein M8542_39305 [Amycolatopsis sp. OK19-0408]|uniref:Uncharacterized protein n=1 Tax=Amycolatopsis iheyensis TaxID=2945988 RepID=A0A9X2NHK6_9PSEU|nr:hypothetical protein [Amycolatopsis iheyensis]MCR6488894.1 hypothetical protein [Amycolatopsis iheyensis]
MAVEGDKPPKSDDDPDYKKFGVIIGSVSAVCAILLALNTLTGFNPLKDLTTKSSTAAPPATSVPLLARTSVEWPTDPPARTTEETEETSETPETTETTAPAEPAFHVRSSQWNGPCQTTSCAMSAVFRNDGGAGSGSATFYVLRPDENTYLAKCSVVLYRTAADDFVNAGCTASSGQLQLWIRDHPGGTVRMDIRVDS